MIQVRSFTTVGLDEFRTWLVSAAPGTTPEGLTSDVDLSLVYSGRSIDDRKEFSSRYALGRYLQEVFTGLDLKKLLSPEADGMWAWLNAVYFRQLAPVSIRRYEHYIPVRKGSAGSLLHRNAARTAFELVSIHGSNASFALQQSVDTHGQLLESLSASQSIAHNLGFFAAAAMMYVGEDGRLRRGATSKPKKVGERKPNETTGRGSIRRLPVALRRLDLTYDVSILSPAELVSLLPKEFSHWTR